MKRNNVKDLVRVSLLVAVMAAASQIAIPTSAVPITVQVYVVALIGYFLGVKKGFFAILVYILLGVVGVPVFAGLQGGVHMLFGYTGGFIFGFIPLVLLCGIKGGAFTRIAFGILGLIACHLLGVLYYSFVSGVGLWLSFATTSLPFIIKDIIFIHCACFTAVTIEKRLTAEKTK